MNIRVLGISIAAIMFVAGLAAANPQAIAANPVLEQVLAIVTGTQADVSSIKQQIEDPDTGLVEIKNEIRNIETDIDSIDQRLAAIEAALNIEPPACVDNSDCNLPNAIAVCDAGQCAIDSCEDGFVDVNQNPADGCEEFFSPPGTGTCTIEELTILGNCGAACEGDPNCISACISNSDISLECQQGVLLLGVCVSAQQDDTCLDAVFSLTANQCIIDNCSTQWETVFGEPPVIPGVCEGEPAGTPLPPNSQSNGDCRELQCDGNGNVISVNDDSDFADDGNECTAQFCQNGNPVITFEPINTPCGVGGVCDGAGNCSSTCSPTQSFCDNECTDILTDPFHCGECGNICEQGAFCDNGSCIFP